VTTAQPTVGDKYVYKLERYSSLLASVIDGTLAPRSVIQTKRNYQTAGLWITLRLYKLMIDTELSPNTRVTSEICWRDHKMLILCKPEWTVGNLVNIIIGVMAIIFCNVSNGITLWIERGEGKKLLNDGIITKKRFCTTLKLAASTLRAIVRGCNYKNCVGNWSLTLLKPRKLLPFYIKMSNVCTYVGEKQNCVVNYLIQSTTLTL
jgi:hypothetical protein